MYFLNDFVMQLKQLFKFSTFFLFFSVLLFLSACHQEKKKDSSFYTINSYPLPVNVSSSDFIEKIRVQDELNEISKKHTKKAINELPNNSYFFLEVDSMINKEFGEIINCKPISTNSNTRFELHKKNNKIHLLIFITYEIATNISELDGEEIKELTVFSKKNQEFNHLALIPIDRIVKANKRKIYLSESDFIHIMDITIK